MWRESDKDKVGGNLSAFVTIIGVSVAHRMKNSFPHNWAILLVKESFFLQNAHTNIERAEAMRAALTHMVITRPLVSSESPWPGIVGLQCCNITEWCWRHCVFLQTHRPHKCAYCFAKSSSLASKCRHTIPTHTLTHTHTCSHTFSFQLLLSTLGTNCSHCQKERQLRDEAKSCICDHK